MATRVHGITTWGMSRDEEGHRTYDVTFRVESSITDGPLIVLQSPGLPAVGSSWAYGGDNDPLAWCKLDSSVKPVVDKENNRFWDVSFTFTTKPYKVCKDQQFENPLTEPDRISGSTSASTEEAFKDRFDRYITNSALEQLRGPQVEFEVSRPTIKIEQNVAVLDHALCVAMADCVNDAPLWGLPRRTIRLASFSWEAKFYGYCFKYYTRNFEFAIKYDTFDRDLLDQGTKVISGRWSRITGGWETVAVEGYGGAVNPDFTDPTHYIHYKDRNEENVTVILDGHGKPHVPIVVQGETYWCLNTATGSLAPTAECFLATCNAAANRKSLVDAALQLGESRLSGPYDTMSLCTAVCATNRIEPAFGDCAAVTQPGRIYVEKYLEANFLLLGIPTTF